MSARVEFGEGLRGYSPHRVASDASSTGAGGRRKKRYQSQPSFHLNIGQITVPRSQPPVRSLGTQTDESALSDAHAADKLWPRRGIVLFSRYVWPALRCLVSVLEFVLSRIGFGFRLN